MEIKKENKSKESFQKEETLANQKEFFNDVKIAIKDIKKKTDDLDKEIEKMESRINKRVNWGIRTVSYTSLIISLGLTMVISVIALTFKINLAAETEITFWELVGVIFFIFLFLNVSFLSSILLIKKKILCWDSKKIIK